MDKVLLDTDILSEYLKGHDRNVAERAAATQRVFTFTSVTVHEIVYGLAFKRASAQLAKLSVWFERNEQIIPQASDFVTAAHIRATARQQGSIVELSDSLIAAVAVRLGLTLATGNTQDFQAIQRTMLPLRIVNWREPA